MNRSNIYGFYLSLTASFSNEWDFIKTHPHTKHIFIVNTSIPILIRYCIIKISFLLFQSGLCSSSELETSRGSIRIQHLTATSNTVNGPLKSNSNCSKLLPEHSRFPRIEESAHFHYDFTDIGPLVVRISILTNHSVEKS